MHLWAVIPVKPFGEGKSRLAQRLDPAERGVLSKQLLTRVIQIAQESNVCAGILVISRDEDVLAYAQSLGVSTLLENDFREENKWDDGPNAPLSIDSLNAALHQGASIAADRGANAVLILPADLPLVTPADLIHLSEAAVDSPAVVIAPSEDNGTNALLLTPPGCIDYAFGINSFDRHQSQAEEKNIPFKIINSPTLAFDVDRPADLDELRRLQAA